MSIEPNQIKQEKIYNFLVETSEVFSYVKKYSILIEERLPKKSAPIHAANELKSLTFHLYYAATKPEPCETDLLEAKEHLCRAFYDLHNIAVSTYVHSFKESLKKFNPTTVLTIFPEYSKVINPAIWDIKAKVADIRAERNTNDKYLSKDVETFNQHITLLTNFDNIIESMLPDLIQYEATSKCEKRKERFWQILITLPAVLLAFGLGYWFNKDQPSQTPTSNPSVLKNDTTKYPVAKKYSGGN